jgi:hypothetical protein
MSKRAMYNAVTRNDKFTAIRDAIIKNKDVLDLDCIEKMKYNEIANDDVWGHGSFLITHGVVKFNKPNTHNQLRGKLVVCLCLYNNTTILIMMKQKKIIMMEVDEKVIRDDVEMEIVRKLRVIDGQHLLVMVVNDPTKDVHPDRHLYWWTLPSIMHEMSVKVIVFGVEAIIRKAYENIQSDPNYATKRVDMIPTPPPLEEEEDDDDEPKKQKNKKKKKS